MWVLVCAEVESDYANYERSDSPNLYIYIYI